MTIRISSLLVACSPWLTVPHVVLGLTTFKETFPAVKSGEQVEFSYDPSSDIGPDHWKDLVYEDGTDNQCGGQSNSPIAIKETSACDIYADYEFTPGNCAVEDFGFEVGDHSSQINSPSEDICTTSKMKVPGYEDMDFIMKQFHIHVSSEHTLADKFFGAELHAVHQEAGGLFAVLGFFIMPTATESNPEFDIILHGLDDISDETYDSCNITRLPHWWTAYGDDVDAATYDDVPFNVYYMIPEGSAIYNYAGGLTTPPCTEAVVWNMVDKPIEITPAQYTDLVAVILNYVTDDGTCQYATIADPMSGSTSRPVQPLNGRIVQRICPEDQEPSSFDVEDSSTILAEDEPEIIISKTMETP